jgi:hypothetical protein
MARGWESKSIEAQQSEASAVVKPAGRVVRTPEELRRQQKKVDLKLSRSRIAEQLEAATNERYVEMLRLALTDVDRQLAELGD